MILVTYESPQGNKLYGIFIRRDPSGMIEVALDRTPNRDFSIGWLDPHKQMGKITMKSAASVRWNHSALKLIEAGKIDEARQVFLNEEDSRKQQRIKKESAL